MGRSAIEIAVLQLERQIQGLLLDFVSEHDVEIEHVEVDTRNHANLMTSIIIADERK